jgi:hypothetical protein
LLSVGSCLRHEEGRDATVSAEACYGTSYSYDALTRPVGVLWSPAPAQAAPVQSGVSFAYGYDANNRRGAALDA